MKLAAGGQGVGFMAGFEGVVDGVRGRESGARRSTEGRWVLWGFEEGGSGRETLRKTGVLSLLSSRGAGPSLCSLVALYHLILTFTCSLPCHRCLVTWED